MIVPLSRNRNYRVLWGSGALTEFGGSASSIALPLMVLAVTSSPATVGLVLGTSAAASLLVGLPAGALVDRWDRKRVMLGCEVVDVVATISLVIALWSGVASVGHITFVAAVWGVCGAMFGPAEEACLPNLVPDEQLSMAVSMNAARSHLAALLGTSAGGFLFALGRFVPFAVDALTHIMGFFMLLFLRVPPREVRPEPLRHLGHEMTSGLRWMWQHRPIRVIGLFAVGLNFFFVAYFVIIILLAQARGVSSGEIGIMAGMMGVGGILGSLVAPYLYQKLSPYLAIIGVFWALALLTPLAIFIGNGYLMGILLASMAFLAPTANTAVNTYQLLLTPDELRGRMSSVMGVLIGLAAVAGPALGGLLMEVIPSNQAILLCAAGLGVVTVLGTISPTLRKFPRAAADPEETAKNQQQGS
jgi:predicted MFS family arabinose efflux permease